MANTASEVDVAESVVEKRLDDAQLEAGVVRLSPREAETLGLPDHASDVSLAFAGDRFHALWAAVDRELRGDVFAETLQLYATTGSLVRLTKRERDLEVDVIHQERATQSRLVAFDRIVEPAPRVVGSRTAATAPARERRQTRRSTRQDRYRLRERGEYDWRDGIGIHKATLDAFRNHVEAGGWDSSELFRLRLAGEELAAVNDFGELMAVDQAKVDHMPHQEATARRVLARMRGRAILADEVGLGKTIEAGLIMKELVIRGMAKRILVLCPATLREQWEEELRTKFDEHFDVVTSGYERMDSDRIITSLHLARSNIDRLTAGHWDLVIWDEAHKGSGQGARATRRLWNEVDTRFLLFLTATPVQNDLLELYRLVEMLRPGTFASEGAFRRRFLNDGDPRQPRNPADLRRLVSDVMVRTTREQAGLDRVRRYAVDVPVKLNKAERDIYRMCTEGLRRVMKDPSDHLRRRSLAQRLTASPRALALTARKTAENHPDPDVRRFLLELAELGLDSGATTRQKHLLTILDDWLGDRDKGQAIVFTQHTDTLQDLVRILEIQGIDARAFHGGMSAAAKRQAVKDFQSGVPVFVSTDAGAEGLNLQFANCVVNYDLPWNPMRIEQRIGRVHRVTQKRDVHVANLYARSTIDEQVYRILHDKLRMFELLFGQVTTILGELEDERDRSFESLILDALLSQDDGEMSARLKRLGDRVDDAWATTQVMLQDEGGLNSWVADRSHRADLSGQAEELRPEMIATRVRQRQSNVRAFVHDYLETLGIEVIYEELPDEEGRGAFLSGIVPDHLVDDLGGRRELHLAFDGGALDIHPDAELCAAGTEIFELLVLSLSERGDLLAEMPPTPDLADQAFVDHTDDVMFGSRTFLGPIDWAGEAVWRVRSDTDDAGDQIIRIEVGDPDRLLGKDHAALSNGSALPKTIGGYESVRDRVLEASLQQFADERDDAQADLEKLAAEEKQRLLTHFQDRENELLDRLSRVWAPDKVQELEAELDQVRSAEAQLRGQRAAKAELRADLLALRLVGSKEIAVEENWLTESGAFATVSATWDGSALHYADNDGETVDVLTVCQQGHPADRDRCPTCTGCGRRSCASCRGKAKAHQCNWCAAPVCAGCRKFGLCQSCATPEQAPDLDHDGLIGWRLGGDNTVLVGSGMALIRRGDESATLLDGPHGTALSRARSGLAVAFGARQDIGIRRHPDPKEPASGRGIVLARRSSIEWYFDPDGPATVDPAPEVQQMDLPEPQPTTALADHPLKSLVEQLRNAAPPHPPGALVVDPLRQAVSLSVQDGELVIVRASVSGSGRSWTDIVPLAWCRMDVAGFTATASAEGFRFKLTRLNASYVLDVEDADGDGDSWFVPAGPGITEASERAVLRHFAGAIGPDDILGLDNLGTIPAAPTPPDNVELISRELSPRLDVEPQARLAITAAHMKALGLPGGSSFSNSIRADHASGFHQALVAADSHRPRPMGLRRRWELTETWARGSSVVPRPMRVLEPGEAAVPVLDDTSLPAAAFDICDRAHLHDTQARWTCPSCADSLCRACGPDGALRDCSTCGRPACGRCRSEAHDVPGDDCGWCGDGACADCGTVVEFDECRLCGLVVCSKCLGGDWCSQCENLRPADGHEVAALPPELCAHGLDVEISSGRRQTVVTLVGHERRELAVLTSEGEIARWITVVAETVGRRKLRLAAARRNLATADLTIRTRVEELSPPAPQGRTLRDESVVRVRWQLLENGEIVGGGDTVPARLTVRREPAATEMTMLAEHLGGASVPELAEGERRAALERLIPQRRSEELMVLEVVRAVHLDRIELTPDGLRTTTGPLAHQDVSVTGWRDDDPSWFPVPTAALVASVGAYSARLAAWGPIVTLTLHDEKGERCYRIDDSELPFDAIRLAAATGIGRGAVVPARVLQAADVDGLVVLDADRILTRAELSVQPSTGPAMPHLVASALSIVKLPQVDLPDPSGARVTLENVLRRQLLKQISDEQRSTQVVDVGLAVTEKWRSGEHQVELNYSVTPGDAQARTLPVDRNEPVHVVAIDDDGHVAAEVCACECCQRRTCRTCTDAVKACDLCETLLCGMCMGDSSDRCGACTTLQRVGRLRRTFSHRGFAEAMTGASEAHRVTFAVDKEGKVHRSVAFGAAEEILHPVALAAQQAAELNRIAERDAFHG